MDWLRDAVIDGLQRLLVLRLQNSPAEDTLEAVAEIWIEVFLSQRIIWVEKLDQVRIAKAFLKATATFERWEAPAKVLQLLPKRNEAIALPAQQQKYSPMPSNIKEVLDEALYAEDRRKAAEKKRLQDEEDEKRRKAKELVEQELDPYIIKQFFQILVGKHKSLKIALKDILTPEQLNEINIK